MASKSKLSPYPFERLWRQLLIDRRRVRRVDVRLTSCAIFEEDAAVQSAIFRANTRFSLGTVRSRRAFLAGSAIFAGCSVGAWWSFGARGSWGTVVAAWSRVAGWAWWSVGSRGSGVTRSSRSADCWNSGVASWAISARVAGWTGWSLRSRSARRSIFAWVAWLSRWTRVAGWSLRAWLASFSWWARLARRRRDNGADFWRRAAWETRRTRRARPAGSSVLSWLTGRSRWSRQAAALALRRNLPLGDGTVADGGGDGVAQFLKFVHLGHHVFG